MGNSASKKEQKRLPGALTGDKYNYQNRVHIGDIIGYHKQLYLVIGSRGHNHIDIVALTPELLSSHFPPVAGSNWALSSHFPPVANFDSAFAPDCKLVEPCLNKILWNDRHMQLCKYYDVYNQTVL